jgi:hypothetical protein
MYQWHKLFGLDNLYLLRFDKTRPVWTLLRRSPTDLNEFVRKWPMVDVSERCPILEKELGEFFIEGLKPRDARE